MFICPRRSSLTCCEATIGGAPTRFSIRRKLTIYLQRVQFFLFSLAFDLGPAIPEDPQPVTEHTGAGQAISPLMGELHTRVPCWIGWDLFRAALWSLPARCHVRFLLFTRVRPKMQSEDFPCHLSLPLSFITHEHCIPSPSNKPLSPLTPKSTSWLTQTTHFIRSISG